jgi:tripartite-type tricarboxylate transporter receptor subunit TctC
MKLPRRNFLHLAAGAAALPALSRIARSQAYPSRPVRVIVPFAPTGDADLVAPLMGQWLSERLGQPFIIENRPGAGRATEAVVRAPADGYMLLLVSTANAVNATLYEKLNFNFLRDVAPVATIYYVPNVMAVHPSFPAKTIPRTGRRRCADVRQFRYAQASKPPRYLMRILPDSLERPAHALFSRVSCPKEEIMKRTLIAASASWR